MSYKISARFRRIYLDSTISKNNSTHKHPAGSLLHEELFCEDPPEKPVVVNLKIKEAVKYQACPRHGRKYLVRESGAVYCFAETKGERFERCFYHVEELPEHEAAENQHC